MDTSQDRLAVFGQWHGRDVRVLIDTGARNASVSAAIAATLSARPGERSRHAGASGRWVDGSRYDVDALSIGSQTLATLRATDDAQLDKGGFDFQLGLAELAPYVVDLVVPEGLFCLRRDLPAGLAAARLPLLRPATTGSPDDMLEATVAGTRFPSMVLDTGAGTSSINEVLLPTFPHRRLEEFRVTSVDATGVETERFFVEVQSLCVLEVCDDHPRLMPDSDISALVGHPQQGLVGMPFVRGHRVILDFIDGRVAVDPRAAR